MMNEPPENGTDDTISTTVDSYLGDRKQTVSLIRADTGEWWAVSNVVQVSGRFNKEQSNCLDKAAQHRPGIAYRTCNAYLQAYALLAGDYDTLADTSSVHQALEPTDQKLVDYLAHAADHLEFKLGRGADVE